MAKYKICHGSATWQNTTSGTLKRPVNTAKPWIFTSARLRTTSHLPKYQTWHLGKVPHIWHSKKADEHGETTDFHVRASGLARPGTWQSTTFGTLAKYHIWHSKKAEKHGETTDFHVRAPGLARPGTWQSTTFWQSTRFGKTHADHSKTHAQHGKITKNLWSDLPT